MISLPRRLAALLLTALPSLLHCAPPGDVAGGLPALDRRSGALLPGSTPTTPLVPGELFTGARYIGQTLASSCPIPDPPAPGDNGAWNTSLLFPVPSSHPTLRDYCLYEWAPSVAGAPPVPARLPKDPPRSPMQWLSPDPHTVAPLGPSRSAPPGFVDAPAEVYERLLLQQQRFAGIPDFRGEPSGGPFEPASVAVIDTSPTVTWKNSYLAQGRSPHGLVMTRLIDGVACPTDPSGTPLGPCAAQVRSVLGLPQVSPSTADPKHGGFFGTQGQLAAAIYEAVSLWKAQRTDASGPRRLVLNLSVGWVPPKDEDGERAPKDLPAPARSVHLALVHAACHGALIVAAAGNADGSLDRASGPMLPAGWEAQGFPSGADCQGIEPSDYLHGLDLPQVFPPAGVYAPLVHAAAALDGDDSPINTTRAGGVPRLAAPGLHGPGLVPANTEIRSADGGQWLPEPRVAPPLTGTSVAAAYTTGIAATLWAYAPSLTASEIMATLYARGVDLSSGAEFPNKAIERADTTHRVNLCEALAALCKGDTETSACSALDGCVAPVDAGKGAPFRLSQDDADLLRNGMEATEIVFKESAKEESYVPECFALSFSREPPIRLCPNLFEYGVTGAPWIDPQPSDPGCGRCTSQITPLDSYTPYDRLGLFIYLDSAGDFENVSVAVTTRAGERLVYSLQSTLPRMAGLTPYQISGLPLPRGYADQIASVELTLSAVPTSALRLRAYTVEVQAPYQGF